MLYTNSLMNYKHSYDKNQYFFSYHLIFMLMTVQIQLFRQFGLSFSCFCQSKFNFSANLDCYFHIFASPNSTFQTIWTVIFIFLPVQIQLFSQFGLLFSCFCQSKFNYSANLDCHFHIFVSPNSTFQPIWTDLYISLGYINIRKSYMLIVIKQ